MQGLFWRLLGGWVKIYNGFQIKLPTGILRHNWTSPIVGSQHLGYDLASHYWALQAFTHIGVKTIFTVKVKFIWLVYCVRDECEHIKLKKAHFLGRKEGKFLRVALSDTSLLKFLFSACIVFYGISSTHALPDRHLNKSSNSDCWC